MEKLGLKLRYADSALELLAEKGFDPVYGARPLRRTIQGSVEDVIAEMLLEGKIKAGDKLIAKAEDGKVIIEKEQAVII